MFLSEMGCEVYWMEVTEDQLRCKALVLVMLFLMLSGN
jgi:hypothetical protein